MHDLHLAEKRLQSTSQRYRSRKNVHRYDRLKKLQAASHLWVRMHMHVGFQAFLHVSFAFPDVLQEIALLC